VSTSRLFLRGQVSDAAASYADDMGLKHCQGSFQNIAGVVWKSHAWLRMSMLIHYSLLRDSIAP